MVLLDLQNAIDTGDLNILLGKRQVLGIQESALNREHSLYIGSIRFAPTSVSCGVPQGSILGPLLFLICIKCKLILYADDSALLVACKNCAIIQQRLSSELESIWEWLIDNKLSLHFGKTESVVFGSKRSLKGNNSIDVICDGQIISSKLCLKYLGVELDQSLSNNQTADNIVSQSNAKIKFLYQQRRHFNMKIKKLLTSALIQCHFDYASASWYSGLTKKYKNRLQTTQKKFSDTY